MNSDSEENGLQYVVSLPTEDKRINFKRVSLKELPPAVAQILKCSEYKTQLNTARPSCKQFLRNVEKDDVGLKILNEHRGQMSEHTSNNACTLEPTPKRIRTEIAMQFHKQTSKAEVNGDSVISPGKTLTEAKANELGEVEGSDLEQVEEPLCSNGKQSTSNESKKRTMSNGNLYYCSYNDSYMTRRVSDTGEKRKGKPKLFRSEWLDIDIFKDWLDRDPTNPSKARCIACNTTMNAGKSELEKHATGARHCQNVELMQQQEMILYHTGDEEEAGELVSNVETSLHEGEQVIGNTFRDHHREQEVDALNRLAASVDNLSSNITVFFEKLCSNQESLIQILQQIAPK